MRNSLSARGRLTVSDLAFCAGPMLAGVLAAGALGLLAGLFAGLAITRFMRARRHRLLEDARDAALMADLPDALDLVAAALQSGAPTARAFAVVAAHLGEPLGPVLRAAVRRAEEPVGPALSEAIRDARPRVLRPLAACLSASEELGTPLAPALHVLARDERERRRVAIRIQIARVSPRVTLVVSTVLAPASLILIVGAQALTMIHALRT